MSDDTNANQQKKKIHERPLDPTRDAEDILGDPTGRDGVTTGAPSQISAEPDEVAKDDSVIRGGEINGSKKHNETGFSPDEIDEAAYNKKVLDGMSSSREAFADDHASEEETQTLSIHSSNSFDDDALDPMGTNRDPQDVPIAESGEEGPGGTAPDPETMPHDAGSLMATYTGEDPDPNMDNPQELGIADRVDEDEEAIEES